MNKETFCAYPFNTVFLGADGGIKTCCSLKSDLGNINEQNIQEILQSKKAQSIRQSIIEERWHPECVQCKTLEAMGARSERVDSNSVNKFQEFNDATKETFKLQKLDLRWSNLCNLACNYCYEYFSSKWTVLKGLKINANKETAESGIFTLIAESKESILDINLLGGEPLLQKQNHKLINLLPTKKFYILTNLSVDLPNNLIAQKLFKNPLVEWGISFETIGPKFEYVRHGADWETFVSNLRYLNAQGVKFINAHPLYCTYSAFNLCEYYDFLIQEGYFHQVYWCAIQNIDSLNVFKLPHNLKLRALDELNNCIDKYKNTKFDVVALEQIRLQLQAAVDDKDASAITKPEFNTWLNEIEVKYLTDKKYSFNEIWPDIINEFDV